MSISKPGKPEFFFILLALVFLLAIARPLLFDPAYKKFIERSQQVNLEQGDVVLLVVGEKRGGYMDYRLSEVWRNRQGSRVPWNIGDRIPELREVANEALEGTPGQVVFYKSYGDRLDQLGSFFVLDDKVSIKLDIGVRSLWARWLNRPVPLAKLKAFIRDDAFIRP